MKFISPTFCTIFALLFFSLISRASDYKSDLSREQKQNNKDYFPFAVVVDHGGTLPGCTREESVTAALEHLVSYAETTHRDEQKADYLLTMLKLIYSDIDSAVISFGNWDILDVEIDAAHKKILELTPVGSRVNLHASIWKARLLIKSASLHRDRDDYQMKLAEACLRLRNAHALHATDSCLLWEAMLFIRLGLRSEMVNGHLKTIDNARAIEMARNALNAVGGRYKNDAQGLLLDIAANEPRTNAAIVLSPSIPGTSARATNDFMSGRKQKAFLATLNEELIALESVVAATSKSSSSSSSSSSDSDDSSDGGNNFIPVNSDGDDDFDMHDDDDANDGRYFVTPKRGPQTSIRNAGLRKVRLSDYAKELPKLKNALGSSDKFFTQINPDASFVDFYSLRDLRAALSGKRQVTILTGSDGYFDTRYSFPNPGTESSPKLILYRAELTEGCKWYVLEPTKKRTLEDDNKPNNNGPKSVRKKRCLYSLEEQNLIADAYRTFLAANPNLTHPKKSFKAELKQREDTKHFEAKQIRVAIGSIKQRNNSKTKNAADYVEWISEYLKFLESTPNAMERKKGKSLREAKIASLAANMEEGVNQTKKILIDLGITITLSPSKEKKNCFRTLNVLKAEFLKTNEETRGWQKLMWSAFENDPRMESLKITSVQAFQVRMRTAEIYQECRKRGLL